MLPVVTDSLDAIPEAARGAYVERNGKFHLDAEIEDTSGLKANNAALRKEKEALQARAKLLGDRTAEDVQADFEYAAKAREDAAKAAGNYEELKKVQAAELTKRDQAIAELKEARRSDLAKRTAVEAISTAGGKVKKLLDPILKEIKVVEVDGELVAQVVDAKGNPRIVDGQGTPMTVAQLVEKFKADDDYANDFLASGSNGSGARNDSGARSGTSTVLIPKNATPQEYRRMKDDALKRGVPYAVAS
jgi:hypothetical protein